MDQPRGRDTCDGAVVNSSGKSPEVPSHLRYLGDRGEARKRVGGWTRFLKDARILKETEIKTRDVYEYVF